MKCPRCGLILTDQVPRCQGCGFSIQALDRKLKSAPKRSGFVNDFANLLSSEEKMKLENRLSEFQRKSDGEIVLAIVKSTRPVKPSEYVFWLFNHWEVGGESHAGLILLLALSERRIESEVGYSWEHIISDVESGMVLDEHVVPLLKEDKIPDALREGIEQLISILEQPHTEPSEDKPPSEGGPVG